ncbi:hypothetical protein CYA_0518 [Synechococcus sp. JA-3-3Ab]|nr:hypothetical protein CYA_0518 [Synechococcus sp. JA-3-3Ab]
MPLALAFQFTLLDPRGTPLWNWDPYLSLGWGLQMSRSME